jgi:predicted dehydrogenase
MMARKSDKTRGITRRTFLARAAAAAGTVTILPGHVWAGPSPNGKVNLACVGISARGGAISEWIGGKSIANVVALCDIDSDEKRAGKTIRKFSKAPRFQDFREMLDKKGKDIDALTVGTADHSHFPICMLAMSMGKHVYVEKPLAHTFEECQLLIEAEKKHKVACQMGNQGHSSGNYGQFEAWTKAGVIKNIRRIDAYMNSKRRWHGWGTSCKGYPTDSKPSSVDWDTWTATSPERPFSKKLHYGNWRCWFEFGNGAFGDWGPHILDTAHEFLELGLPHEIEAVKLEGRNKLVFPQASTIKFSFPARGEHPPCVVTWYDGTRNKPPRPEGLGAKRNMGSCGKTIYGDDLTFMGGTHHATVRIIPENKMKEMNDSLPRVSWRGKTDHADNFLKACRGEETCRSRFAVSGVLTQVFMLGVIAQRLGGTLKFDLATRQITNNPEAKALLAVKPRPGWEKYYGL